MDENANDDGDDYEVGYGRPPFHSRWPRGQSGNPAGRPRGAANRKTLLEKVVFEQHTFSEAGRRKTATTLEIVTLVVRNAAIKGDPIAMRLTDRMLGYQPEIDAIPKGVFFTPEKLTKEEWGARYAHYDDGTHTDD